MEEGRSVLRVETLIKLLPEDASIEIIDLDAPLHNGTLYVGSSSGLLIERRFMKRPVEALDVANSTLLIFLGIH